MGNTSSNSSSTLTGCGKKNTDEEVVKTENQQNQLRDSY